MAKFSKTTEELIEGLREQFLIPVENEFLSEPRQIVVQLRPPYKSLGEAFLHNLDSVISTVTIPFTLVSSSVNYRHRVRLRTAECIRTLSLDMEDGETEELLERRREQHALKAAEKRMAEFAKSPKGVEMMVRDTCAFLRIGVEVGALDVAAKNLLLQGVVLVWGSFEVLAHDLFVAYVNQTPKVVKTLIKDPVIRRKIFQLLRDPIEMLAEHDFDLSNSMGSVLAERQDLSDLLTLKKILLATFADNVSLREALSVRELWTLNQQRHLIVHRRGVVDKEYIEKTGRRDQIGSQLVISPTTLEYYLALIRDAGVALLQGIPAA